MFVLIFTLFFSSLHGFSNGGLDTTFNPSGAFPGDPGVESVWPLTEYSNTATLAIAQALVIDANGKIVAAGDSDAAGSASSMTLMRLNDDGSLDTTLNPAGVFPGVQGIETITNTNFGVSGGNLASSNAIAHGIGLLSDGRIVLAGSTTRTPASNNSTVNRAFAAALLDGTNGALDPNFNIGGTFPGLPGGEAIWTVSHGTGGIRAEAFGVTVQANDRIVLAGFATTTEAGGGVSVASMSVARILTSGLLDTSFNAGHTSAGVAGIATLYTASLGLGVGIGALAFAVTIQPDQNIVLAGVAGSDMVAVRMTPTGGLDPNFNAAGFRPGIFVVPNTELPMGGQANAVTIQPDGKIVLAGSSGSDFAIVRLTAAGVLDTSFNGNGIVLIPPTAFDAGGSTAQAFGVQVQSDGAIVAGGMVTVAIGDMRTAIARVTSSGALDTTFIPSTGETGTPGAISILNTTFEADTTNEAHAMTLDSQERIVLAGDADPSGDFVFAFARLASSAPAPTGPVSCIAAAIIAKYCS